MKKIFLFVIASVWALGMSAQKDVKGTTEFGINLGYDFGLQSGEVASSLYSLNSENTSPTSSIWAWVQVHMSTTSSIR